MSSVDQVIEQLQALSRPDQLEGMARYGMTVEKRLGVSIPHLRKLAKGIGVDHGLALALWETGIAEARIVAAMVDVPEEVTEAQMEDWVAGLDSWDVCDQLCMNLFDKTPLAWRKVREWSEREEEFVKRAAYALLACLAWHDKGATDEQFTALIPLIVREATDGRNYVKKAVSWALRHIGKRNARLNEIALEAARQLQGMDDKTARWIGTDAVRDLTSDATRKRLAKQGA
ncbi:MAG: DNA alkylation repair protein [Anaerolineae bacterium]|nr:DNA alkylation repair protein [Anaerolineae bacterium]